MRLVVEHYPEMSWLTGDVNATPEGTAKAESKSLSENLFGKKHIEFDRTAVGLMTLLWVLRGDYENFTACQKGAARLSREEFAELQAYTKRILGDDPEAIDALIAYTVINDLGKIKSIVSDIEERTGVSEVDHDKILYTALETNPQISPSFNRLSDKYKRLIVNGLKAEFNLGQFIQGENVPASLQGLIGLDEASLDFYLIHVLFDIAGAAGHVAQNGSVVMTGPTYQGFKLSIASLEKLATGEHVDKVYDDFLSKKARTFGLDITQSDQRAVARICCMLRLSDRESAQTVLDVFRSLPENERAILEKELNVSGVDNLPAILLYYSPATLANAQKALVDAGNVSPFETALRVGLKSFARAYQEARIHLRGRSEDGVFTVDVSELAQAAKDPLTLDQKNIDLEPVGDNARVTLKDVATVNPSNFSTLSSLSELPGNRVVPIGIGGGSDVVQAAVLGKLLQSGGKDVPAVISIRTSKTGSQGSSGRMGEERTVENPRRELAPGIYEISPQTTGSGRFLENVPAREIPVYLIIDTQDGTLSQKIDVVLKDLGEVDTVFAVDTGGDALYSTKGHDQAKSTPDQDIRVLRSLSELDTTVITAEVAVGVDSPENAEGILQNAKATYYNPSPSEETGILTTYAS